MIRRLDVDRSIGCEVLGDVRFDAARVGRHHPRVGEVHERQPEARPGGEDDGCDAPRRDRDPGAVATITVGAGGPVDAPRDAKFLEDEGDDDPPDDDDASEGPVGPLDELGGGWGCLRGDDARDVGGGHGAVAPHRERGRVERRVVLASELVLETTSLLDKLCQSASLLDESN